MADIYLDLTSGNDTTGDGTYALPYLTLSKCNSVGSDGDTVILIDGTHNIGVNTNTNVTKDMNIRSENNDSSTCIIDGGGLYYWQIGTSAITTVISDITFQNMAGGTHVIGGLGPSTCDVVVLRCVFKAIVFPGAYRSILGCGTDFNNNNNSWVMIGCIIDECEFSSSAAGIITDLVDNLNVMKMYNCTIYNSGQILHSLIYGKGGTNVVKNCVYYSNSTTASYLIRYSGVVGDNTVTNTCGHAANTGAVNVSNGAVTEADNITTDPLFVDAANQDFRLKSNSPCINSGDLI